MEIKPLVNEALNWRGDMDTESLLQITEISPLFTEEVESAAEEWRKRNE